MPHIALNTGTPGIAGLFEYRPETARPLRQLAEVLLRGPSTLAPGERELIAAAFSMYNRYVDGLAAVTPEDPEAYAKLAERLVTEGYLRP
jgi:hypothetical protein